MNYNWSKVARTFIIVVGYCLDLVFNRDLSYNLLLLLLLHDSFDFFAVCNCHMPSQSWFRGCRKSISGHCFRWNTYFVALHTFKSWSSRMVLSVLLLLLLLSRLMLLLVFMFPTLSEVAERWSPPVFGEVDVKVCRGREGDQLLVGCRFYEQFYDYCKKR